MGWVQNLLIDRGYTGHEHLTSIGLIHMNGRIYDPQLRRFLSPDNYVQDTENTQNFNRFGYVYNNPLLYTDPSGELAFLAVLAIAVIMNGINNMSNGIPFWHGMGKTIVMSAITGGITAGIGAAANAAFSAATTVGKALFQAGLHGIVGGIMSSLEGGSFESGFAAGAISSLVSSGISALGETGEIGVNAEGNSVAVKNKFGNSSWFKATMIASAGLSGGLSSSIAGGSFWAGARQGVIVAAMNHLGNHVVREMKQKGTTIAGIYGAGSEDGSGNPDLREKVEGEGGKMFTSTTPIDSINDDNEIIAYLKDGYDKGNDLKIYGHSRGGAAAVRIANKLGAMNIHVTEMILYDPVAIYGGGDFVFTYPNVMKVTNYYQRNPVDGLFMWADNPFIGSPVSAKFQWPQLRNVNLTGIFYRPGVLMSHLNITRYAIKNP